MATIRLTTSTTPFEKFGTPKFSGEYIHSDAKIPVNIEFNVTYYKYVSSTRELKAFRILAIALRNPAGDVCALVQYPNTSPNWVDHTFFRDPIFESKQAYFNYAAGYGVAKVIDWCRAAEVYPHYHYASVVSLKDYTWTWEQGHPVHKCCPISYFFINEDGAFACIGEGFYISREECIKDNLNGMTINEFTEEPFKIATIVLPATQQIHTLRFVEE